MLRFKTVLLAVILFSAIAFIGVNADAAPFAYITNYGSNNVSVIDTAINTVVATVPVGSFPYGVTVNPSGTRAYVANQSSNNVSVIDTANNTVIDAVPVGNAPLGVAVNPTGTRVYVTNYSNANVSVIDTATNTVVAAVPVGTNPIGVAVNPSGTRVYVTNYSNANVSVIDTASNTVVATVPVGGNPHGVAVNPSGTRVYAANNDSDNVSVIDTATNTVVDTVPVGSAPIGVAVNPTGTRVYVTNSNINSVSVIDTATNTVVAAVPVGTNPIGVAVDPTGTRAYAANNVSDNVSVIDTATNTVVVTVSVGDGPMAFGQFIIRPEAEVIINTINTIQGGGGCFIATAAYGSYFEPHVEVLRDFRDSVLITNRLGKAFVKFYYNTSPPVANYIAKHESMKMAVRWLLTPLVYGIKYPGVAVMTLLGLVLVPVIRRKKTAKKVLPLLLLSLLVFAPLANAFDAHIISPKVGEERFVNLESTKSIAQGKTKLGVFLDYAENPVGTANNINLSEHQFVATATAGYGISDALQVSISVPYLFDQRGKKIDGIADASAAEFGDFALSGKYRIADNKSNRLGLGFAVSPYLVIDTGASDDWFGSGTFYGGARLVVDKEIDSATRASLNIGYQIKETEVLTATQEIGDTISYGLGISHDINNDLFITGEAYVSTPSSDAFNEDLTPMEADLSLGYNVMPDVQLILGAGAGSEGIGAPNWRVLTGVRAAL